MEPLVIGMGPNWSNHRNQRNVFISLAAGDTGRTIGLIEGVWKKIFADAPFGCGFFNDHYRMFYAAKTRMGSVIRVFSALAILVSCLGLFGLAWFMAERRTREIGIRKVLEASASRIAVLLSGEFTRGVTAANLVAWPSAYLALRLWLRGYTVRTPLDPGMFLAAGAIAFSVAVLTVGRQVIRASRRNPVESIRYE